MTGDGVDGEAVLRVPRASPSQRARAAHRIVDLVDALVVDPRFYAWPSGGEPSFTWPGGFGPVSRAEVRELLLAQMLDPLYLGDNPVFPIVTSGGWHVEVIHSSPPGSSVSMGLYFSGPAGAGRRIAEVAARGGWRADSARACTARTR